MDKLRLKALAKINLGLDVLRRREDGYHEVRMIMQTVGIYDQIELVRQKEPGIRVKTNLFYLPENENNLVYKAAKLLMDEFSIEDGVFIDLNKYIPVAAGMAGGSSDAASVLYGMNRMFQLGLSRRELMERGVSIGADVPYCILRGTALAEGIGEKLTALPPMPKCWVLVAKPGISVSTKFVYENLHANELRPEQHPDIDAVMEGIEAGNLRQTAQAMGNVLELVTAREHPVIEEIKAFMKKQGALNAMMSGSGPTVFGLFEQKETARRAFHQLQRMNLAKQVYLTQIYNNGTGGKRYDG
ncbi:MAG: 4-(cytidine 5'-diphospho)-2-C-methyl-D-erythritol kinase [Lachnospiraceae bacterium]|nr:4-(cytidine 5'-diphospho)-2-C-methyl-D-erythritol kinase [Lachnospiraceae bacterium]MDY5648171.1 4-(cytidine 5'-diphospho)-2-C-methyl-D-erythritol kinase [Lachnospiraceae bacterium]